MRRVWQEAPSGDAPLTDDAGDAANDVTDTCINQSQHDYSVGQCEAGWLCSNGCWPADSGYPGVYVNCGVILCGDKSNCTCLDAAASVCYCFQP